MTILVVTAVRTEVDAVVRDLGDVDRFDLPGYDSWGGARAQTGAGEVHVVRGGVGPVAAAAVTGTALALRDYDVVFSAGVGGGFPGRTAVGDVVVGSTSVAADLGCRTDDGFISLKDMGLGQDSGAGAGDWWKWRDRLLGAGLPATSGQVVTLSCMTGTDRDAEELAQRFPSAVAEGMEGWGVVWPAYLRVDQQVGEIRAISNLIGRRDPASWDLGRALDVLSRTFAVLLAEPLP